MTKKIEAPLTDSDVEALRAGESVLVSGKLYMARDAAHKKFKDNPPFDIKGQILFYASPTPSKPGAIIGSVGPTTAGRMDAFTPALLDKGLKAMIGKGERSAEVVEAMKKNKAVYLVVPGGVAALLSKYIKQATVIAYPELGPEAVQALEVVDFPTIVAIDSEGNDIFEIGKKNYSR
ncbi:fumarate hydratase [candidate division WOR-1 bacterium RIFCSPHIGHO2_01_FULL_53_15]|uniref:Fumarate hydratase n=1 Tax=candidate division WOR-1 bacterium RIFCSPHIGHO2_01_FULL_53_15 TaxID=1802564 RepID=A0A1F4Q172_UNCSA|nr:MAG: fumarate hydratase [candidate division WOR-1 bacterium RIFCSPHIGHO2_01_FULL_53_15]OGC13891.1 MAG: fumarate hydratase [candidate division WOR-1 bacterium RIFCSPHIGHO2_02_FULL_53_26]